ncbi:10084_t:CDS:1, partial [Scutellospora calospora]
LTVEKVSNIVKLYTYYVNNARNKLNYISYNISKSEFEQVIENYTNTIDYSNNIFNEDEYDKEFDTDFVSNDDNLVDLIQFDNESLETKKILDFNTFLDEQLMKIMILII